MANQPKNITRPTNVVIGPELKRRATEKAEANGMTLSEAIRARLAHWVGKPSLAREIQMGRNQHGDEKRG